MTVLFVLLGIALALLTRWALFIRINVRRAPYCPVCREARGRFMGVGEGSGQPYYRCPHCGNVYAPDRPVRP